MILKTPIRTLCIIFDLFLIQNTWKISKIKIICIFVFHSFQNVSQLFGPKNQNGSFFFGGGEGGCITLTRKSPKQQIKVAIRKLIELTSDCKNSYSCPRDSHLGILRVPPETPREHHSTMVLRVLRAALNWELGSHYAERCIKASRTADEKIPSLRYW